MEFDEQTLNMLIAKDPAKRRLLSILSDGTWHNENELMRNVKRIRPIGFIGFTVLIDSLNQEVHLNMIENGKARSGINQFRINEKFVKVIKNSIASFEYH
jgi:hypothetical protein